MKSLFPSAPTRYRNSCRCHYRGQWYHLGPWDTVNDQPSAKAIARYRSLEASIEAAPDLFKPPPSDFPVVKLLADFKEWSADRGVRGYSLSLVKNTGLSLAAVFPDVLVRDFGPKRFKAWIASLKGLSSATRRKYARTALAALSWGIGEEMFEANECKLTELRECDPLEECTDAKAPKVVLPVEDAAIVAILSRLCRRRPADRCIFRPADHTPRGGERYSAGGYRQAVRRAAKLAGVPEWNPYQLRHLRKAQVMESLGSDAAKALLGHSSPVMTARYAAGKIDAGRASEAARLPT